MNALPQIKLSSWSFVTHYIHCQTVVVIFTAGDLKAKAFFSHVTFKKYCHEMINTVKVYYCTIEKSLVISFLYQKKTDKKVLTNCHN